MEPIRAGSSGEAAAQHAANLTFLSYDHLDNSDKLAQVLGYDVPPQKKTKIETALKSIWRYFCSRVLKCWDTLDRTIVTLLMRCCRWIHKNMKAQANLFLNGLKPYRCSYRLTGINILVACSTWYLFMDQIRLAFLPPEADFAVSVISWYVIS